MSVAHRPIFGGAGAFGRRVAGGSVSPSRRPPFCEVSPAVSSFRRMALTCQGWLVSPFFPAAPSTTPSVLVSVRSGATSGP